MKTINDILTELGFDDEEKVTFLDILNHAKTLKRNMVIDQLKPYMNQEIDKLLNRNEDTEN